MNQIFKFVMENMVSGKIDKNTAIMLTKMLKQEGTQSIKDIAVIGIGLNLPGSDTPVGFWKNIKEGRDFISPIPDTRKRDMEAYLRSNGIHDAEYSEIAYLNEIDKFDYSFFGLSPKEASLMEPSQRLFLETVWKAIEDAGYGGKRIKGSRTGIYVGYSSDMLYKRFVAEIDPSSMAIATPGNIPSVLAGRIAYLLDLKGPSLLVDTACSSSLTAVHLACQGIRNGECELALAGGVRISLMTLKSTQKLGIESSDGRTKTFDDISDGTGSGEGVAAILLKPLDKAMEDGDHIYAVIKGSAINQDGDSIGLTAPNPEAQEDVIVRAWRNARVDPETISYIEAHGTGTKLGDPIEINGIQKAFRRFTEKKQFCAIGSLKTNMGHLDNAAGISGLIKSVMALKHKEIPPSLHFNRPNRKINFEDSPVYINDRLTGWVHDGTARRCGVSAFGLSGTNCHVVLEEAPEIISKEEEIGQMILALSAKTKEALEELAGKYIEFLNSTDKSLADICYTANTGREHYSCRIAVVCEDIKDCREKIKKYIGYGDCINEGIYFGIHMLIPPNKVPSAQYEVNEDELQKWSDAAGIKIKEVYQYQYNRKKLLEEICELYVKGANIPWEELYIGKGRKKQSIPTYPFERTRCWLDLPEANALQDKEEDFFFGSTWKAEVLKNRDTLDIYDYIIIVGNEESKAQTIIEGFKKIHKNIIEAKIGDCFKKSNYRCYTIRNQEDYFKLLEPISDKSKVMIVHLASLVGEWEANNVQDIKKTREKRCDSFLYLIKAVNKRNLKNKVDLVAISEYVQEVNGREQLIIPENAPLFGLCKIAAIENLNIRIKCIDIDDELSIKDITSEAAAYDKERVVAYRGGVRYVERIGKTDVKALSVKETKIEGEGAYIITGGTGKLGLKMARYLSSKGRVHIVLVSRSGMPDRSEWKSISSDSWLGKVVNAIEEVEKTGSKVSVYAVDVSEETGLYNMLEEIRARYGKINGIIHCAGVGVGNQGNVLSEETTDAMNEVLAPKMEGTWLLHHLTENDPMDFFLLFSSAITVTGGIGSGAYTAANTYLDSFAAYMNKKGRRVTAIDWPTWETAAKGSKIDTSTQIFELITTKDAFNALDEILNTSINRVIAGKLNYQSELLYLEDYLPFSLSSEIKEKICKVRNQRGQIQTVKAVLLKGRTGDQYSEIEKLLAKAWGSILGLSEIGVDDDFFVLGGNSISAIKLEADMEKLNIPISVKELYEFSILSKLAAFIEGNNKVVAASSEDASLKDHCLERYDSDKKELFGIEPFNDIYFKSCFYNSMFPVVRYFNRDIDSFLVNEVMVYFKVQSKEQQELGMRYINLESEESLLRKIGISMLKKENCTNVVETIKAAIDRGCPVILWVDYFYASIREDVYMKSHGAHTWLVYGYNDVQKTFNIIEHKNRDSLSYEKTIINFQELTAAYQGYLDNFRNSADTFSYYEFDTNQDVSNNIEMDYYDIFTRNVRTKINEINEGLKQLKSFCETFEELTSSKEALAENAELLLKNLNEIINIKNVEKYRAAHLFNGHDKQLDIIFSIFDRWEFIRTKIGKFLYTSIYNGNMMAYSKEKLEQIYELEKLFYNEQL